MQVNEMNDMDLTAVIDSFEDTNVDRLLSMLADTAITITRPPVSGLMMMTVQDSFGIGFHPGEVLVTEARVVFNASEGFGMVLGDAPRKALVRAACDAILRCPEPSDIQMNLKRYLTNEISIRDDLFTQENALIASTKVNFDLMPGA